MNNEKYWVSIYRHVQNILPDAGLLEAFTVFDSSLWPAFGVTDYGNQQNEELAKQYSDVVDQQATLQEWGCFVNVVQNSDNLKGKIVRRC